MVVGGRGGKGLQRRSKRLYIREEGGGLEGERLGHDAQDQTKCLPRRDDDDDERAGKRKADTPLL